MKLAIALAATLLQLTPTIPPSVLPPTHIDSAIRMGQAGLEIQTARVVKRVALVKTVEIGRALSARARIALASRRARTTYQPFTAADVTPELSGDYVLVVLPPQPRLDHELITTAIDTVLVLPKGVTNPSKAIRPLWTTDSLATLQNLFGATWTEKTVFAAFPATAFGKDMELVAIYAEPTSFGSGPAKREIRAGVGPIE